MVRQVTVLRILDMINIYGFPEIVKKTVFVNMFKIFHMIDQLDWSNVDENRTLNFRNGVKTKPYLPFLGQVENDKNRKKNRNSEIRIKTKHKYL